MNGFPYTRVHTPLITSMDGGDILLCQTLTPTDMRIERYDPALRMRWSTLFQLSGGGGALGHIEPRSEPLEEDRLGLIEDFTPQEIVFPPFHAGSYMVLVSAIHDTTQDSVCALGRFFDSETGKLLYSGVLHRGGMQKHSSEHGYRTVLSPDSSKLLFARISRGESVGHTRLDFMVISAATNPRDIPVRTAQLNCIRTAIKDICIDNAGDIIVAREAGSTVAELHKFAAPDYGSSRQVSFTRVEPDGTGTALGAYKVIPAPDGGATLLSGETYRQSLKRVNLIAFDFRDSAATLRGHIDFSPEIFEQIIGEEEYNNAILHSVLASRDPQRYIAIFERRFRGERYSQDLRGRPMGYGVNVSGDILIVGFDPAGGTSWVRAIERKFESGDPDYIILSFNAAISPRNTLQIVYRGSTGVSLNEFRVSDGESVTGNATRFILETGGGAFFYRPSVTWLKDGALLMVFDQPSLFSHDLNVYRLMTD